MSVELPTKRLVILIAAHKNVLQLSRLIRVLKHPQVTIYIHLDKKSDIDPSSLPSDVKVVKNRVEVTWSLFSQVQAMINSMKQIIENEHEFDYLTFISGQDYPVLPMEMILEELLARAGTEFLHHVPLDETGWNKARIRFERYYFSSYTNPLIRVFGRLITFTCDKLRWKRRFYKGMPPWGGSSWWTLTRPCILYILTYLENNRQMVGFMKKTIFADEMIFHTIIMNSSFAGKTVSDNLRYIEWTRGNPNPHILTSGYFEKIIAGHYHFARKFDTEVDTTILDMLDAHRAKTLTGWVGPDRVRMHPQAGHSLDQTGNQ